MTQPQQKTLSTDIALTGMRVRTNNANEMNPETAKISGLWQAFTQENSEKFTETTQTYGVYTNYESNHMGEFDVIACATNIQIHSKNSTAVTLPAGEYLVFSGHGTMPTAVIAAWQQVWTYFSAEACPHKRSFTTDFEHYVSKADVDLYIAILT